MSVPPPIGGCGDYPWWALAWLGVAGVGIVNGGVHRLYIDPLGELAAHQVSGLTIAALYYSCGSRNLP